MLVTWEEKNLQRPKTKSKLTVEATVISAIDEVQNFVRVERYKTDEYQYWRANDFWDVPIKECKVVK